MSRRPTLKQARAIAETWESSIHALMAELGLPKTEDSEHIQRWRAQTLHGALDVTLFIASEMYRDAPECMSSPELYSRFDEPRRAKSAGMSCNPHTGKWNWHPGTMKDIDEIPDVVNQIRQDIANILIRCPEGEETDPDLSGCGSGNVSTPDDENWVDCFNCGLMFDIDQRHPA